MQTGTTQTVLQTCPSQGWTYCRLSLMATMCTILMWTADLHQRASISINLLLFLHFSLFCLLAHSLVTALINQVTWIFFFYCYFFYQKVYALQIKWGLFIIDGVLAVAVSESKTWVLPLCRIVLRGWRGRFERKISGLMKSHTGARISATRSIKTTLLEPGKELVFKSQKEKDWIPFMWSNFKNKHRHFLSLLGLPSINAQP